MKAKNEKKISLVNRLLGIIKVFAMVFKYAPSYFLAKMVDIVISSLLPLATTYFAAATTTALAEAYDGNHESGSKAIIYMIITAVMGIIYLVWNKLTDYINTVSRYKITIGIDNQLHDHFLNLDFWRYDDKTTADLFEKASRFPSSSIYIFNGIANTVSLIFTLIASLVALSAVGWWLCVILLISIIPGLAIQIKISRMQINHWKGNTVTRRSRWMLEGVISDPGSIAELKIYGVIKYLLKLRLKYIEKSDKESIDYERKYMAVGLVANAFESLVELVALIYTTMKIINRDQPVGQFVFVQQLISRSLSSASSLVMALNSIDEDTQSLFDFQEFMSISTSEKRAVKLTEQPKLISLKNVTFHYPNHETNVLNNISLDIHSGQHIAIVGENGAGKTTLIKLILGLYNPTEGQVTLDNNSIKDVDLASWHDYLGVLQQDFIHYHFMTARENICIGNVRDNQNEARIEEAIRKAEAEAFLKKLPLGLDTYLDRRMGEDGESGTQLSGGQWQRVALARNFYRNSPIIILDEPTSAIDALAESRIFERLFADKDRTVITISHRLTTVEKADMIYMLENGSVIERGKHEELVALKGKYYEMFKLQLHK